MSQEPFENNDKKPSLMDKVKDFFEGTDEMPAPPADKPEKEHSIMEAMKSFFTAPVVEEKVASWSAVNDFRLAVLKDDADFKEIPPEQQPALLYQIAKNARSRAYAPYSKFLVGAALVTVDGKVYTGVNIENASYPLTNCAERSALFAAVSQGERQFAAIAICGGAQGSEPNQPCFPCGACRQALCEFCSADFPVVLSDGIYRLGELMPHSFQL